MMIIRIPAPLRAYTDGMKQLELSAESVRTALEELVTLYPAVKPHLMNDDGTIRAYVNLFVNDKDVRELQGADTPISENDRLMIIPSIAGGSIYPTTC